MLITGAHWPDWLNACITVRLPADHDRPVSSFVRIEDQVSVRRGIPVVPGSSVNWAHCQTQNLPDSLAELSFRNGIQVR